MKKPPKAPGVIPETRIGAIWHMDTTDMPEDPVELSGGLGKNVMLTLVEAASGFVMAQAQRGKTAATTTASLTLMLALVPARHGDGEQVLIRIDDGVEFKKDTGEFLQHEGYLTQVVRKEHNGKVERMHQTIMKQIDKVRCERQKRDPSITGSHWVSCLGAAVHHTNTQKNPGAKSSRQERYAGRAQAAVEVYQTERVKKRAQRRKELESSPLAYRVGDRVVFRTHSKTMSTRLTDAVVVWVGASHLRVVFLDPGFWNVLLRDERRDRGRITRHPAYDKPFPSGENIAQHAARRTKLDVDATGSATLVVDNFGAGFRWNANSCFMDTAVVILRVLAVPFGMHVLREEARGTPTAGLVRLSLGNVADDAARDQARLQCPFLQNTGCGGVGPDNHAPGSLACILNGALSPECTTSLAAVAICSKCYTACELSNRGQVGMFSTVQLSQNLRVSMSNVDEIIMANG